MKILEELAFALNHSPNLGVSEISTLSVNMYFLAYSHPPSLHSLNRIMSYNN